MVASWGLATLILTNAYNCLLISFVTLPIPHPLINSIYDVPSRQDVFLATNKGLNIEAVLLVKIHLFLIELLKSIVQRVFWPPQAADNGILKQLGDRMRSRPDSSCPKTQDCINLVKSGSFAYIAVSLYHGTSITDICMRIEK